MLAKKDTQSFLRLASGSIPLECFLNNRSALAVNENPLGAIIIDIANRGRARIFTASDFFTKSALRIFRKRINIVFAETKIVVKHKLSLRRVFKPRTGEFERVDFVCIEHVDDPSAVHAVAGKAVGMPCKNSISLTRLNPGEHVVENRPAWYFGRLFFNQLANNHDFFAFGKLA